MKFRTTDQAPPDIPQQLLDLVRPKPRPGPEGIANPLQQSRCLVGRPAQGDKWRARLRGEDRSMIAVRDKGHGRTDRGLELLRRVRDQGRIKNSATRKPVDDPEVVFPASGKVHDPGLEPLAKPHGELCPGIHVLFTVPAGLQGDGPLPLLKPLDVRARNGQGRITHDHDALSGHADFHKTLPGNAFTHGMEAHPTHDRGDPFQQFRPGHGKAVIDDGRRQTGFDGRVQGEDAARKIPGKMIRKEPARIHDHGIAATHPLRETPCRQAWKKSRLQSLAAALPGVLPRLAFKDGPSRQPGQCLAEQQSGQDLAERPGPCPQEGGMKGLETLRRDASVNGEALPGQSRKTVPFVENQGTTVTRAPQGPHAVMQGPVAHVGHVPGILRWRDKKEQGFRIAHDISIFFGDRASSRIEYSSRWRCVAVSTLLVART